MQLPYREHIEEATGRVTAVLTQAAARPGLLNAVIAGAPGWDLYDLTDHLGQVHRWVVTAIVDGHGRGSSPRAPREPAALLGWFETGAAQLLAALAAPPETPAWSFSRQPGHDRVGFWLRRQAQENLVHAWDAETAVGAASALDPELAWDGVVEVADVFVPRMQARAMLTALPYAVLLRPTDVTGELVVGEGAHEVGAELTGPAQDLLLHVWKRVPDDDLQWTGDVAAGRAALARSLTP